MANKIVLGGHTATVPPSPNAEVRSIPNIVNTPPPPPKK